MTTYKKKIGKLNVNNNRIHGLDQERMFNRIQLECTFKIYHSDKNIDAQNFEESCYNDSRGNRKLYRSLLKERIKLLSVIT